MTQYQPQPPYTQPQPPYPVKKRKGEVITLKLWQFILSLAGAAIAGFIAISIILGSVITVVQDNVASKAEDALSSMWGKCRNSNWEGEELFQGNDGSLNYSADEYAHVTMLNCLAKYTGMPDSVKSKIEQASALDGNQSDTWDGIKAAWSYDGSEIEDSLWLLLEASD